MPTVVVTVDISVGSIGVVTEVAAEEMTTVIQDQLQESNAEQKLKESIF